MFDYPAIYKEADDISNKTQKHYLNILRLFLCMLVISSIMFTYFDAVLILKVVNAVISLGILALCFIFHFYNFQGIWYTARAVAESVKTISWRYAMKIIPYNTQDNVASNLLIDRIKSIIDTSTSFKDHLTVNFGNQQAIPSKMTEIRHPSVLERRNIYAQHRIIEQRDWYNYKSKYNQKRANLFSVLVILVAFSVSLAIIVSVINTCTQHIFPVSILLTLTSVFFVWLQTKNTNSL